MKAPFRPIDGHGTNRANDEWGAADTVFLRVLPSAYADGISAPAGPTRPSARLISNQIFAQPHPLPSELGYTNVFWLWGQFIDHDLTLSETNEAEPFPIEVPPDDPVFNEPLPFFRTQSILLAQREQRNSITSFLDASMVYGSSPSRLQALRLGKHGLLREAAGSLLPVNDGTVPNAGEGIGAMFVAGDVRANEHIALAAMHTAFLREHNRLATKLAERFPSFDDETLFQKARTWVIAEVQHITYHEFVPLLIGDSLPAYAGFNATVNPQISNAFATAAFRFGHSVIPSRIYLDGTLLRQTVFASYLIANQEQSIGDILNSFATTLGESLDAKLVDDLRNTLFGPPGAGGTDLAALNIQRGRDHGLPSFQDAARALGLPTYANFAALVPDDPGLATTLTELYGDIEQLDLFVGGLLESRSVAVSRDTIGHAGILGPVFAALVRDQFARLRDGDPFWYELVLNERQLCWLEKTRLSDVLQRNLEEHECVEFQPLVMLSRSHPWNDPIT